MALSGPRIAVLGTLDTKGKEIEYVRGGIAALGGEPLIVDTGILGEPGCEADIAREEVARAAGYDIDEVRRAGSRGAAVELMQDGARKVVRDLYDRGQLDGALCLGGAEGA